MKVWKPIEKNASCCRGFDFPITIRNLSSSASSFTSTWEFDYSKQCIGNTHQVCCFSLSLLPRVHIFSLLKEFFFFGFCSCFVPFVQKTMFWIHCQSFIKENLDHVYHLTRMCMDLVHWAKGLPLLPLQEILELSTSINTSVKLYHQQIYRWITTILTLLTDISIGKRIDKVFM